MNHMVSSSVGVGNVNARLIPQNGLHAPEVVIRERIEPQAREGHAKVAYAALHGKSERMFQL